jgi:hypothetical protein
MELRAAEERDHVAAPPVGAAQPFSISDIRGFAEAVGFRVGRALGDSRQSPCW